MTKFELFSAFLRKLTVLYGPMYPFSPGFPYYIIIIIIMHRHRRRHRHQRRRRHRHHYHHRLHQ